MRAILDTNVLIDSTSDPYTAAAKLIEAIQADKITFLTTPAIEREYQLLIPQRVTNPEQVDQLTELLTYAEEVVPESVDIQIDDREDYKFLQAAVGGAADYIVTSDRHLLSIGEIDSCRVVTPTEAWY